MHQTEKETAIPSFNLELLPAFPPLIPPCLFLWSKDHEYSNQAQTLCTRGVHTCESTNSSLLWHPHRTWNHFYRQNPKGFGQLE